MSTKHRNSEPVRNKHHARLLSHLAALFHRRWAVPVLAQLHKDRGAKAITLTNHLGVSRESLHNTLDELIQHGWIARNPGYGHPMRPEYLLTRRGEKLGPTCVRLMAMLRKMGIQRIALRKWSMPITLALAGGVEHFGELKRILPGITSRALTLGLKELQRTGLIERRIVDQYPPTTSYRLTRRGRRLVPVLQRL